MTVEEIAKTEYSEEFDNLRKRMMITSFYKYGLLKENYANKLINSIDSLEKRLEAYKKTGNAEFLADVANFAMIEFMCPQHPNARYRPTDSDESPGIQGICVQELKTMSQQNWHEEKLNR